MKQWIIKFGQSTKVYYTEYHAEQFARALRLHKINFTVIKEEKLNGHDLAIPPLPNIT